MAVKSALLHFVSTCTAVEFEFETTKKSGESEDNKRIEVANIKNEIQMHRRNAGKELNEILRANDLYDDLHKILHKNGIGLDKLQNEFQENDKQIDALSLNIKQKLKFRKLIRIIGSQQTKPKATVICRTMQILLIGDSGVGKTSLIRRYIHNTFRDNCPSLGVDYMEKQEYLSDDSMMKLKIWDSAGQEKYHSLSSGYYRNGDCIILCYDMSDAQSFSNCDKWREQIKEHAKDDVIVILVGCKSDTIHHNREEYEKKALDIINQKEWNQLNTVYCECSAKINDNVRNVFITVAELENKKQKKKAIDKQKNNKPHDRHHAISTRMDLSRNSACKSETCDSSRRCSN
eukprot:251552_1